MAKSSILEHLEAAKRSHIKWLNRAIAMTRGSSAIRDPHPLESTACKFGLWFNSEGNKLYHKLGIDGFERIDILHNKLHDKYLLIYEIYFGSAKGIVYNQKAILTKNTISSLSENEALTHMNQLKILSYEMLEELAHLEKTIKESEVFE